MGYTGISKKIILYNPLNLYNDLAKFCKHTRSGDSVEAGTRERLEIAIRARELADIYEKNGFEGLYAEGRENFSPDRLRESAGDDIPF
ncbi:hypothetical protein ES708_27612 [subsurface metagenome]